MMKHILVPVDHLRTGDRADHWTFVYGAWNDAGRFVATWYSPSGKLTVIAHSPGEAVFADNLVNI